MIFTNYIIKFIIFYKKCIFYSNSINVMIVIILQLFLLKEIYLYLKNMLISKIMCISANSLENSLTENDKFTFFLIMQFNFVTTFIF